MVSSIVTHRWSSVSSRLAATLVLWAASGQAEEFRIESIGARGGIPENNSSRFFNQAEFFTDWYLPWNWRLGDQWHMRPRLDFSIGWLGDFGNNAAIGTLGPELVVKRDNLPVSLAGGVSPTVLSRTIFGSKDFGINFQFTSRIGLDFDIARHWRFSYRFQHMSDAHLSEKNPALNMHMFGLSYVF